MTTKVKFELKRQSSKAVQKKLLQLSKLMSNPSRINKQVSTFLLGWVNRNFKTEGGMIGIAGWKKLKAGGRWVNAGVGWVRWDPKAKILQDTGLLKASFISFYGRTFAGVGSDLSYSVYHEAGLPTRGLPQRRMLPIASDRGVSSGIIKIYDKQIQRILNK